MEGRHVRRKGPGVAVDLASAREKTAAVAGGSAAGSSRRRRRRRGGGGGRRVRRKATGSSGMPTRISSGTASSTSAPVPRLPLHSPFKPMDRPRAHSDGGEEFDAYLYESYSSQFSGLPRWTEVAPVDNGPFEGAQYGEDNTAARPDGSSRQPSCDTAVQGAATTSKRVPRRKENYSKNQDLVLCSAYLNVSRDPIVGTNQSADHYWSRIHQYFHENQNGPSRTKESLQYRWSAIQKDTSRFCAFKAEQDRLNRSGKTEQDRAFHAAVGKDFQFMHRWEALRNENKWHSWLQGTVESSRRVRRPAAPVVDEDAPNEPSVRPIGRDSAKKRRSDNSSSSANNSACLEVLQRLTMSKERELDASVREAAAAAEAATVMKAVEQEKVAVKKELIQIKQEELRIRQEELREARRQREEEADLKIMLLDLSQFDPVRRAFFERS